MLMVTGAKGNGHKDRLLITIGSLPLAITMMVLGMFTLENQLFTQIWKVDMGT
jgi:hypothetical protein